ncbi:MAG: glycoside hydrolase family 13 protein [Actinomycetales bacterium]|nr:glycoside hydrolase family 13 protein [Actinomycetales bacterium]
MNRPWWVDAVVYQVYLRSFCDADGDGVGDLAGLRARFSHLVELGVDALWLNPCYASPQRDHGYDIADYFAVDPQYGSVDDIAALVQDAHAAGLRVLMDMVANHCSDQHPWFVEALAAPAGSPARDRFLFRDGTGPDGKLPPNNWGSVFGGPAWTRAREATGEPGQWYLHSFDSSQPDLNWRNPEVREYFEDVLRFWFDLGVDGFRIDVAQGMVVASDLPDLTAEHRGVAGGHPMWDQPEVHEIYRGWRRVGDSYGEERYFVGEIWVQGADRLRSYLAPDELHQAFHFDLLVQPWHAARIREAIDNGLRTSLVSGRPTAWALNNHDVHRVVTRYGQEQDLTRPDPDDLLAAARRTGPVDLELGRARARAAAMLLLALPGSVFVYQGEELGLAEDFSLPDHARQDPIWLRSAGAQLGRDGCRVPLPWAADAPSFGFSLRPGSEPWLPMPADFADAAVDRQEQDPDSFLTLYRTLLGLRRSLFDADDPLEWLVGPSPDVLALRRGSGLCVLNFGSVPVSLSEQAADAVVARSRPGVDPTIPQDSAAWIDADRVPGALERHLWTSASVQGAPTRL